MADHVDEPRRVASNEQLRLWVAGESVHSLVDECCPDFSCCYPSLQQPVEVRRAFVAAVPTERDQFLYAFLSALIALLAPNERVHIARGKVDQDG